MSEADQKPLDKAALQAVFERSPFIAFMRLEILEVDHDAQELTVRMPMRPEFERRAGTGQWHGGPMAALVDTAGDFAWGMLVGGGVPTINFRIDYVRPAMNTALTAVAKVRRGGRMVALVDVDLYDDQKKLVAVGRATFSATRA